MKTKTYLFLAIGLLFFSCNQEDQLQLVDFDYQIEGDCSSPALEVVMENKSSEADSYTWDFGDGTSSNETNPIKVYPKAGNYTISLSATFSRTTKLAEKEISIFKNSDGNGPVAEISFEIISTSTNQVAFNINTSGSTYILNFGDGTSMNSGVSTIDHTYPGPGTYEVLLRTENSEGANCAMVEISINP